MEAETSTRRTFDRAAAIAMLMVVSFPSNGFETRPCDDQTKKKTKKKGGKKKKRKETEPQIAL
jgi:hypothetical protein